MNKYRPEDKAAKKQRLLAAAEAKKTESAKPLVVKCGLNHVTKLIEEKKAVFVVIAHDVDPVEVSTTNFHQTVHIKIALIACLAVFVCHMWNMIRGLNVFILPFSCNTEFHATTYLFRDIAARFVLARLVPENGNPILRHQEQGSPWPGCAQEDGHLPRSHWSFCRGMIFVCMHTFVSLGCLSGSSTVRSVGDCGEVSIQRPIR